MKYLSFILLVTFLFLAELNAQNSQLQFNSNINIQSNGLNSNILNTFLFGGFINQELKDKWINSSNINNIVNGEIKNEINYNIKFIKSDLTLSILDRNHININLRQDMLKLILNGNSQYQEQLLEFDNSSLRATRYQQFKIAYTVFLKKNEINFGASYLRGNHNISLLINKGTLYTDLNGQNIDLNYDIQGFSTDTSTYNIFNNNGHGIAIDIAIKFNINKSKINLYIKDLGFIKWNNSSINTLLDSSYIYSGIFIEDLYNFNDSLINIEDNLNYEINQNQYKSYIAADLGINFEKNLKLKNVKRIIFGINARWHPLFNTNKLKFNKIRQGIIESNYKPKVFIITEMPRKNFDIISKIHIGGYSDDINLDLALKFERKVSLILGTQSINQMIFKNDRRFFSLYLKILKRI
tara:strand:- start:289 stop:1518 length:1230 start_codon:yes stop_codon:yes gene_type:complete